MKKILLLFLTFTLVISVFSGCGKNSSKSKKDESNKINYSDTYVFGQDMQNNLFHQEYNNICESKDSYYYLENGFVYIIDKKSHKCQPLCNKTNCLHDKETSDDKIEKCNAFFGSSMCDNIAYYMNNLYFINRRTIKDDEGEHSVYDFYKSSLDGTAKEKLMTLKNDYLYTFTVHRGYIYYSCENNDSDSPGRCLYRIPVNCDQKQIEEVLKYYKYPESTVENYYFYGNNIYLKILSSNNNRYYFIKYNLENGKWKDLNKDLKVTVDDFVIFNDKIIFCDDSYTKLYECDLNGNGKKKILNMPKPDVKKEKYYHPHTDGRYLFVTSASASPNDKFMYYDKNYKPVGTYKMPFAFSPYGICGSNAFIYKADDGSLYYIDMTKLSDKNKAEKVYKLSPDQ